MDNTEKKQEELVLVNAVEEIVKEKAKTMVQNAEMCKCRKCYLNVCAIALNKLKPRYITSSRGKILSSLDIMDYGYQAELTVAIVGAIEIVKKNPRHD
jgi:competence protein ComFB